MILQFLILIFQILILIAELLDLIVGGTNRIILLLQFFIGMIYVVLGIVVFLYLFLQLFQFVVLVLVYFHQLISLFLQFNHSLLQLTDKGFALRLSLSCLLDLAGRFTVEINVPLHCRVGGSLALNKHLRAAIGILFLDLQNHFLLDIANSLGELNIVDVEGGALYLGKAALLLNHISEYKVKILTAELISILQTTRLFLKILKLFDLR